MNGLAGNLGIAVAALVTGLLIKWIGWRAAFAVPGLFAIGCGIAFAALCPKETEAPAKRKGGAKVVLAPAMLAQVFAVMTAAAVTSSLLFNFTTNGNAQLLAERFVSILEDPAALGALLAAIYAIASLAQIVVGNLIDRKAFKPLTLALSIPLVPLLVLAVNAQGWWLFALLLGVMILIFGSIPFTDAMIVRYVDDRLRSRVAGMRLAVSAGIKRAGGLAARTDGQGRGLRRPVLADGRNRTLPRCRAFVAAARAGACSGRECGLSNRAWRLARSMLVVLVFECF